MTWLIIFATVLMCGCSRTPSLPEVPPVDSQSPLTFTVIDSELVVEVSAISAPKSSEAELLTILDTLHRMHGRNGRTVVIFRDPTQTPPQRRRDRSEQYASAFAIGVIDPVERKREVRFGIFN